MQEDKKRTEETNTMTRELFVSSGEETPLSEQMMDIEDTDEPEDQTDAADED